MLQFSQSSVYGGPNYVRSSKLPLSSKFNFAFREIRGSYLWFGTVEVRNFWVRSSTILCRFDKVEYSHKNSMTNWVAKCAVGQKMQTQNYLALIFIFAAR